MAVVAAAAAVAAVVFAICFAFELRVAVADQAAAVGECHCGQTVGVLPVGAAAAAGVADVVADAAGDVVEALVTVAVVLVAVVGQRAPLRPSACSPSVPSGFACGYAPHP